MWVTCSYSKSSNKYDTLLIFEHCICAFCKPNCVIITAGQ